MGCSCGTDKNTKDDKFSLFPDACYHGNLEKMKKTCTNKAKEKTINHKDPDELTPLHKCAQRGSEEALQFLLTEGADVEAVDKNGYTALHVAVSHRNLMAVKVLTNSRAKVNIRKKDRVLNMTPLHLAVTKGVVEIVQVLVEAGADLTDKDRLDMTPFAHAEFWAKNTEAETPLRKVNGHSISHQNVYLFLQTLPQFKDFNDARALEQSERSQQISHQHSSKHSSQQSSKHSSQHSLE